MRPVKITFYCYAGSEEKAAELQSALHDFVDAQYKSGVLVTAERLAELLRRYGRNDAVKLIFKNGTE